MTDGIRSPKSDNQNAMNEENIGTLMDVNSFEDGKMKVNGSEAVR